MNINPIKTEQDYDNALKRINELWGSKEDTPECDEFEILFTLVEAYERDHYPITPPHPIEAIKFRLDQLGMKESELNKILGNRSRKSELFNGKRKLTLSTIRILHQKLNIPLESLISPY